VAKRLAFPPVGISNQSEPLLSGYRILKAVHAIVAERVKWHSDFFDLKTKTTFWPLSDQISALRVHIGRTVFSQLMDYLPERPRIASTCRFGRAGIARLGSPCREDAPTAFATWLQRSFSARLIRTAVALAFWVTPFTTPRLV